MKAGDKITMYFQCFGVTSEEQVTVKSVDREKITIENYFNGDDGEINYQFSTASGKCLNEPDYGFGGKTYLKTNR